MNVVYTDDPKEQIRQGRDFFEEKSSVYTQEMTCRIKDAIADYMPRYSLDSSEENRENMFYRSIYDYWAYGNNVEEEFFYGFYNKSHRLKSSYTTCKSRLAYCNHLNAQSDVHLLNNKYEAYLALRDDYKRDAVRVSDESDFAPFCDFVKEHKEFVVKPVNLGLATGVYKFNAEDYGGGL